MRAVANDKISVILLQALKSQKKVQLLTYYTSAIKKTCIRIWIAHSHPPHPIPTMYFTVKSEKKMDLAPVIAVNFMGYKFFLYLSGLT